MSAARSPTASSPRSPARRPSGCGSRHSRRRSIAISRSTSTATSSSSTPPPSAPSATPARKRSAGRCVELIVPPHLREAHLRGMAQNLGKDLHHPYGRRIEVDAMRADGSLFPIEIVVVRGERGGAPVFLAYLRDLTERKAAERVLAEREEQFRTIAENMPLGLVISDLDTQEPLYINPKARRNLGLGPDEHDREPDPLLGKTRAARDAAPGRSGPRDSLAGRGGAEHAGRSAAQGADVRDAHPVRWSRRDDRRDRRHDRAARDRGGAAGEPGAAECLHGLRPGCGPPARRRRPVPDVQPPHGAADRRAGRGGARPAAHGGAPARGGRRERRAPSPGWSRPARCTSASST